MSLPTHPEGCSPVSLQTHSPSSYHPALVPGKSPIQELPAVPTRLSTHPSRRSALGDTSTGSRDAQPRGQFSALTRPQPSAALGGGLLPPPRPPALGRLPVPRTCLTSHHRKTPGSGPWPPLHPAHPWVAANTLRTGTRCSPHTHSPTLPLHPPISVSGNSILPAAQNPDKNNFSLLSPSQFTGPPWAIL